MTKSPAQPRSFTVEEANRTLPLVRVIVGDFVDLYGHMHQSRERLAALRGKQSRRRREDDDDPYEQEVVEMEADLERNVEELQGYVDELAQVGVQLKDPFLGLVDYRTMIGGREARLCWKPGDTEVGYWHRATDDCTERQSLMQGVGTDTDSEPDAEDPPGEA